MQWLYQGKEIKLAVLTLFLDGCTLPTNEQQPVQTEDHLTEQNARPCALAHTVVETSIKFETTYERHTMTNDCVCWNNNDIHGHRPTRPTDQETGYVGVDNATRSGAVGSAAGSVAVVECDEEQSNAARLVILLLSMQVVQTPKDKIHVDVQTTTETEHDGKMEMFYWCSLGLPVAMLLCWPMGSFGDYHQY